MAEYTQNYNLKKPAEDDFYNVKDFNENADIIDAELKKLNDDKVDKVKMCIRDSYYPYYLASSY